MEAKVPVENRIYTRQTVVLLDETTVFDEKQKLHVAEQIVSLIQPGTHLHLVAFSAFIQDRYTVPLIEIQLAAPLDESVRYHIRKDYLAKLDSCMNVSIKRAKSSFISILEEYHTRTSDKIARSDILAAVKDVGDSIFRVRARKNDS
ncbi:MAG: hypothetical protein IPI14_10500 [Polaromonas sp.]|nr:hypothetical protein [Polaromonas sp.]